jgi:hypothetical protein
MQEQILRRSAPQDDIYEQASVKSEEDRKRIFPNIYPASSLQDAPHNTIRAGPIQGDGVELVGVPGPHHVIPTGSGRLIRFR